MRALRAGEGGPLEGMPLGVKDLFCTEGVRTTACSRILENFVPTYESTVGANLWRDGAVMLGKLNKDEFAMGSSNETSCFGPVTIAVARARAPTRSWCRAARPAARRRRSRRGCALGATGTDTGGSIRQPAAFYRHRRHQADLWPLLALGHRRLRLLARPGRAVRAHGARLRRSCCARWRVTIPKDTTSVDLPVPDFEAALAAIGQGHEDRHPEGIPRRRHGRGDRGAVGRGVEWLKAAGAEIVEVSLPHTKYALPAYYIVAPAEASSNLARYDGVRYGLRVAGRDIIDMYEKTRAAGFGAEVRRRIMIGTYVLSAGYYDAYYLQAQKVRSLIKRDFEDCFQGVDALLTPATPSPAFALGEKGGGDPVEMYLNDIFTVTVNLAGLPGISVPGGLDARGLPLGLQLIGRPFDEETLFALGG